MVYEAFESGAWEGVVSPDTKLPRPFLPLRVGLVWGWKKLSKGRSLGGRAGPGSDLLLCDTGGQGRGEHEEKGDARTDVDSDPGYVDWGLSGGESALDDKGGKGWVSVSMGDGYDLRGSEQVGRW